MFKRCTGSYAIAAAGLLAALACVAPNPAFNGSTSNPPLLDALEAGRDRAPEVAPPDIPTVEDPAPDAATTSPDALADSGAIESNLFVDATAPDEDGPTDATPVLPTPLAHWRLDDLNGTVATDERNLNPGTLSGGASFRNGGGFPMPKFANVGALFLDGRDGFVELGTRSMPSFGKPITVAAWFWNAEAPMQGRKNVIAFMNPNARQSLQMGLDDGRIAVWGWDADNPAMFSNAVATQGWHHIAYSYNGTVHRLYQDGVLLDTSTRSVDDATIQFVRLGAYDPDRGERLHGTIDDVRIYNRALDPSQVLHLATGRE